MPRVGRERAFETCGLLSRRKAEKGFVSGDSGESDWSRSSIAKENLLPVMAANWPTAQMQKVQAILYIQYAWTKFQRESSP